MRRRRLILILLAGEQASDFLSNRSSLIASSGVKHHLGFQRKRWPPGIGDEVLLLFASSLFFEIMTCSPPDNTAKADVARRRIDWLRVARGRAIAAAIVRRAQLRTTLH